MRKAGYDRVGIMDPTAFNQDQVQLQPGRVVNYIYRALSEMHFKDTILLPYNFE